MELGKTYFVRADDYGKITIDGKLMAPIKKDQNIQWPEGEGEIGCCLRTKYDNRVNAPVVEIIKRISKENQIVYG